MEDLVLESRVITQKNSSSGRLKSIPAAQITSPFLRAAARHRVRKWDAVARSPEPAQLRTLLKHCQSASQTEFGKAHHFDRIRTYDDYKSQVPLRTYAEFEPYLDRMRKGEQDVLWPGLIPYYGQSSGSSNTVAQHKFLPISWEQVRWQRKAGFDLISRYLTLSGDRGFTGGFNLGLFPPSILKPESPGVHVGSNPGIMLRHVPAIAKWVTLPRAPLRDIPDYEEKLQAICDTYLHHDVRSISGTTCWFSILFDRLLKTAQARGLKATTIQDIWPNLRVLFGGGVYAEPYRKVIHERIGRPIVIMDNYNATEGGIFSATDRIGDPGMLMLPDRGVFFEFVARAEHGNPHPASRVPLWQVEPGVDYSVVLTTSSGLFGYYIGDFVRFSSVFPHRMEFAGRASGVLSLTQELTSFIEIERSFAEAVRQHPCTIVEYAASSEVDVGQSGKGRYLFLIEFEREPKDLDAFLRAVDQELCHQNRVYREHRSADVAILAPRLVRLAHGSSVEFMERLGYGSVQNKFPRIIDEKRRDILASFALPGLHS